MKSCQVVVGGEGVNYNRVHNKTPFLLSKYTQAQKMSVPTHGIMVMSYIMLSNNETFIDVNFNFVQLPCFFWKIGVLWKPRTESRTLLISTIKMHSNQRLFKIFVGIGGEQNSRIKYSLRNYVKKKVLSRLCIPVAQDPAHGSVIAQSLRGAITGAYPHHFPAGVCLCPTESPTAFRICIIKTRR